MDKKTKNKLAMYKSVKTVIAANHTEWSSLPAFSSAFDTFVARLDVLKQCAYEQNLSLVGVREVKDEAKKIAVEKAFAISSSLVAYAVRNNNVELISHMKIGRNDLRKATRDHIIVLFDRIIASATTHVSELADFGVDQTSIDELITLRNTLNEQLNAPRNAIITRKGQTMKIKTVVRELDAIIKFQLDKLMIILKEDHPDFFTAYTNARIIVDHRNRPSGGSSPGTDFPPERDDGFPPTPHGGFPAP